MTPPTMGRIVIFHDLHDDRPAIVLAVNVDSDATGDHGPTCDLGVFSDLGYGLVRDIPEGDTRGCWSWPRLVTT